MKSLSETLSRLFPPSFQRAQRWRRVRRTAEPDLLFCRRFLSEDEVAIDVGSSVGVMLDLLSAGSLRVIAVEPNPRLAQMIRKMRIENVIVIEAAASDEDGAATLRVPVQSSKRQNLRGTLAEHNRFAAVPHDAVYDRSATSHAVNLFDMAEKYADVSDTDELLAALAPVPAR